MKTQIVEGGGGLELFVREGGKPDAKAILFIHGWSQTHLCWSKQYGGPLADEFRLVAMDIRGHGQSEAPLDAENYTAGALWAEDVRNVLEILELDRPILVGWSYAGLIIGDYIRRYGDDAIAGVNFVNAAIGIGKQWFGPYIGPGFLDHAPLASSEDQEVALKAIQNFLHTCFVKPIAAADMELAMGWNMLVHPRVRGNLIARDDDFRSDLAKMAKPVLVTYGNLDTVLMPSMAKMIQDHVSNCKMSEYQGVGHAPFIEQPDRFNTELCEFARHNLSACYPNVL